MPVMSFPLNREYPVQSSNEFTQQLGKSGKVEINI